MVERRRKTKAPCPGCFLHRARCICAVIPRLEVRTRLVWVPHSRELKRTTNTGRLALRALVNSLMRVRGQGPLDLSDLLNGEYRSVLYFPSQDAVELNRAFVESDPRPLQLIVPDGNWRQAAKVGSRQKELRDLPRVKISETNHGVAHLRREHLANGMSTLEAIAKAYRVIEGAEVYAALMEVYRAKLDQTLAGRGAQNNATRGPRISSVAKPNPSHIHASVLAE
ncbi:MAG TPA: tRNA-uridine aminocarboxypropyltransferase [Bdellovibrionales bacterium]|nr:tRNA-uridine aminocarboxypropyltransferase [Bdellovibrionales bacterium]